MAGQTCSELLSPSSNRIALDPPLLGPASILSGELLFVRQKLVNQCSNATLGLFDLFEGTPTGSSF